MTDATASLTIASLSNRDVQSIVRLILPIQQVEFGVPITLEDQPDLVDIEAAYIQPGGGFWGAHLDGELVGTIALINTGHAAGALRKMFVKKEYRGKELAIGQHLMDALTRHCREQGVKDLYLGTIPVMKAAHRFYERNGFQPIDGKHLPSYFPRMATDTVFYHLHLK